MTMLYRHFDKRRRLLYVGISADALKRAAEHGHKPWGHLIARITVEHFETRALAEAAEKAAILAEAPIHNIVHVPQRRLPLEAAAKRPLELRIGPQNGRAPRVPRAPVVVELDLVGHLAEVERSILERALRLHGGNRTQAGREIGLSLRQMRYRMQARGVSAKRPRAAS